jgi:hypothetical protein
MVNHIETAPDELVSRATAVRQPARSLPAGGVTCFRTEMLLLMAGCSTLFVLACDAEQRAHADSPRNSPVGAPLSDTSPGTVPANAFFDGGQAMSDAKTPSVNPPGREITLREARDIALATLAKLDRGSDLALLDDQTQERAFGWVFSYTTRKYLQTHSPLDLRVGLGPLVVERDGRTQFLNAGQPRARAIENFEAEWRKRQTSPAPPGK